MLKQPSFWVYVKNHLAVKSCRQAMHVGVLFMKNIFFLFSWSRYRRALVFTARR